MTPATTRKRIAASTTKKIVPDSFDCDPRGASAASVSAIRSVASIRELPPAENESRQSQKYHDREDELARRRSERVPSPQHLTPVDLREDVSPRFVAGGREPGFVERPAEARHDLEDDREQDVAEDVRVPAQERREEDEDRREERRVQERGGDAAPERAGRDGRRRHGAEGPRQDHREEHREAAGPGEERRVGRENPEVSAEQVGGPADRPREDHL